LDELFGRAALETPTALRGWDDRVAAWLDDYYSAWPDAQVQEVFVDVAVFLFDLAHDRVVLAYAVSTEALTTRDRSQMAGFPDLNQSVRSALGDRAFVVDKGHFLGHASGGRLDINLFAHRRELNRGVSLEGRAFRSMERFVARSPGTFFYHLARYDDATDIPDKLEYGVHLTGPDWWIGQFDNKGSCLQRPANKRFEPTARAPYDAKTAS